MGTAKEIRRLTIPLPPKLVMLSIAKSVIRAVNNLDVSDRQISSIL